MPEKLGQNIALMMIAMSFMATLAKLLSEDEPFSKKRFLSQLFIGTVAGMIFGCIICWLVGENIWAVAGTSGAGSVLGIKGVQKMGLYFDNYIKSKLS